MSRRLAFIAAALAAVTLLTSSTLLLAQGGARLREDASARQAGRATGTVRLTIANSTALPASAYESRSVGPRAKPLPELKNVVIFFADLPAVKGAPMQASISQKDEQFSPHLVAVTANSVANQTVTVLDDIAVTSLSCATTVPPFDSCSNDTDSVSIAAGHFLQVRVTNGDGSWRVTFQLG